MKPRIPSLWQALHKQRQERAPYICLSAASWWRQARAPYFQIQGPFPELAERVHRRSAPMMILTMITRRSGKVLQAQGGSQTMQTHQIHKVPQADPECKLSRQKSFTWESLHPSMRVRLNANSEKTVLKKTGRRLPVWAQPRTADHHSCERRSISSPNDVPSSV